MKERPSRKLAVILQRETVETRWESHRWALVGAIPDVGGGVRTLLEDAQRLQRLYPGFEVSLYPDEAEGYYLNVSTEEPSVFISLRQDGEGNPYPFQATLSYNEAARWMDGGEEVDRVRAWPELAEWLSAWVEANYRPEPKRPRRPRSFEGKEGRLREKGAR
jgi:Protein of unknown function (DUF3305)